MKHTSCRHIHKLSGTRNFQGPVGKLFWRRVFPGNLNN